jgi:uncharacterized protein (DUF427 family)
MSTRMQDLMNGAHGQLRHEPIERRVRAENAGRTVVDTTRALLVWEPRRICPSYAVPAEDIDAELLPAPASDDEVDGLLHPGIPFRVHTAEGQSLSVGDLAGAGFRFGDADLDGYVELDFAAFDAWYEEAERIRSHPRDPFHRVDVLRTDRPLRIEIDGEVVAETSRARLLFETRLPTRFYVPREDVLATLEPSDQRSYCPYKGQASYWSVEVGDRRYQDVAWSYEDPLPDLPTVTGLIAFWNERVDIVFDGERHSRPGGAVAAALRDEFGV